MTEHEAAIELVKDKMFRISPKSKRAHWLSLSPKMIIKYIDCSSPGMLRHYLRKQYPDHPKGALWNISPEMALTIVMEYGLA